jgi:hypothetical protein
MTARILHGLEYQDKNSIGQRHPRDVEWSLANPESSQTKKLSDRLPGRVDLLRHRLRGLAENGLLGNSQVKPLAGVYAAPVCQDHAYGDQAIGAGRHRGLCVVRRALSL